MFVFTTCDMFNGSVGKINRLTLERETRSQRKTLFVINQYPANK